jgi:hypothetical protein
MIWALVMQLWSAAPSDGVTMKVERDSGATRIDYDFHGHGGWASVRQRLAIDLPENYAFTFALRGHAPPNTLQFKLIDSTGDNVWWSTRPDMVVTPGWTTVTIRRRRINFAWGPLGGGAIRHVAAIELAIVPGAGGRGTLWIEHLAMRPLPVMHDTGAVKVSGSTIDFGAEREIGGLDIQWDTTDRARSYDIEPFHVHVAHTRPGHGGHDYIVLPDAITRYVKVRHATGTIRSLTAEPPAFADSVAGRFADIARNAPRGAYPRYLHGEQPYWTVFGSFRQAVSGRSPVAIAQHCWRSDTHSRARPAGAASQRAPDRGRRDDVR